MAVTRYRPGVETTSGGQAGAVCGLGGILVDRIRGLVPGFLPGAIKNGERIERVVNDILTRARIDSGEISDDLPVWTSQGWSNPCRALIPRSTLAC